MALLLFILTVILLHKLGKKGKAYREEIRLAQFGPTKEKAYRRKLEKEGLDQDLITIILPIVMGNNGK